MQALPDSAESLCIVEMGGKEGSEETRQGGGLAGLFLNIGLEVWSFNLRITNIISSLGSPLISLYKSNGATVFLIDGLTLFFLILLERSAASNRA